MQPVDVPDPVLCQLILKHGQRPHLRIYFFWKIGHPIVTILHKICDQFRIFTVILLLTVVFDLLGLLHSKGIYLNNADSVCYHPGCKAEPVMSGRLKAEYNLIFLVLCSNLKGPCSCTLKPLDIITEFKGLPAQFTSSGIDCPQIMCFAAYITAQNEHVILNK